MSYGMRLVMVSSVLGLASSGWAQQDFRADFSTRVTPAEITAAEVAADQPTSRYGLDLFRDADAARVDRRVQPAASDVRLGGEIDEREAEWAPWSDPPRDTRAQLVLPSPPQETGQGEVQRAHVTDVHAWQDAARREPPPTRVADRSDEFRRTAPPPTDPFATRATSILEDPPERLQRGAADPLAGPPMTEQAGGTRSTVGDGSGETSPEQEQSWLWILLVGSVAANGFFCWIAWDAHAKYQDLVADISEDQTRSRKRRRRSAPRELDDIEYLGPVEA